MGKGKHKSSTNKKKKSKQKTNQNSDPQRTSDDHTQQQQQQAEECVVSLYRRYKQATHRVKTILESLAPHKFRTDLVQNFVDAVDHIVDDYANKSRGKGLLRQWQDQLLADLKLAIQYRTKYSQQFYEGGDDGHTYFVTVLNYCYSTLKACRPEDGPTSQIGESGGQDGTATTADEKDTENTGRHFTNAFAALSANDQDEGEEEMENDFDEAIEEDTPVRRPAAPERPCNLSLYLTSVPESVHALRFFELLDFQMGMLHQAFGALKDTMKSYRNGKTSERDMYPALLSLGVTTNRHLEHVQRMESTLALECPTLTSIYRILACAFQTSPIRLISDDVRKESPIGKRFSNEMALALVADLIESVFRGQLSDYGKEIVTKFCKRWKLPPSTFQKIENFGMDLWRSILRDTATRMETIIYRNFDESSLPQREWLKDYSYLSGSRSFLNTLKLLDLFRSWAYCRHPISDNYHHIFHHPVYNYFNLIPMWHEKDNPATAICGDMDTTVPQSMLLLTLCVWTGHALDHEKELLPLVHLFRHWFPHDRKCISFTHAFAAHMIAASLFEIQGDDDVATIADLAQTYVRKYTSQLLDVKDYDRTEFQPQYQVLVSSLNEILTVDPPVDQDIIFTEETTKRCEPVAIWNPVCSAMIVQYVTLGPSFLVGNNAMDMRGQTRSVLHLFNALKQRRLVDDNLPVISTIDKYFGSSKAIWNGWGKPERGKFTYRFSLCLGLDNRASMEYQACFEAFIRDGETREIGKRSTSLSQRLAPDRVDMVANLREVSDTYVRVIAQDSRLVGLEKQSTENQEWGARYKPDPTGTIPMELQEMDYGIQQCLQSAAKENDLLQMNLFVVGILFDLLLEEVFPSIERTLPVVRGSSELGRAQERIGLIRNALGVLDYVDVEDHFSSLAGQFERFFRSVEPSWVMLDVP